MDSGETRRVVLGELSLAYRSAGESGDPSMVLLHGMGENAASWDPVLPGLAGLGYHVVALDARGHGDSGRPGVYSYELLRADVLGVLDALGIDRCVLVGHSMGAGGDPGRPHGARAGAGRVRRGGQDVPQRRF